jgi:stage IV sporulation protein B
MIFLKHRKKIYIFLSVCFVVLAFSYIRMITLLPGKLTLMEGEEYVYDFKSPLLVSIKADKEGVVKLNNSELKGSSGYIKIVNPISLKSVKKGCVNLKMRIFGVLPLKTMEINVVPSKKIVACGNTIGVKLRISGILVIGLSDVEDINGNKSIPAKQSGIKPGDLITQVNKVTPKSTDDLIAEIEKSKGEKLKITYKRGNSYNEVEIKPVMSVDDKKYHIGLWVRDSTAGIGTLTFYDPQSMCFGALGHGITDLDTGALMPVDTGEILESNILAIKRGKQGNPGELKGVFIEDRNKLGVIKNNCDFGIYGTLDKEAADRLSSRLYPMASRNQVKEGPATILANVEGNTVKEYSIEIQKVSKQRLNSAKGMVIKITDKKLLDMSGGIVQGMSGSPIIQDGRIVGAVTHVLVNDPTRGYGIFIEKMMQNVPDNAVLALKDVG